jgi:hypothetical protein
MYFVNKYQITYIKFDKTYTLFADIHQEVFVYIILGVFGYLRNTLALRAAASLQNFRGFLEEGS